jgi:RNA polymerase sigma factor (TIGR02999 family)
MSTGLLFAALYDELHRLAERQLRRGGARASLSTTTLLHEAYLGMSSRLDIEFPDRARFMAYAARAMRGIVIDYARRAGAQKRGGGVFEITLTDDVAPEHVRGAAVGELEQLSDALDALARFDPLLAELVDLHFFCGLTFGEIGELRNCSERTVQRDWRKARLLLHGSLLEREAVDPHA